MFPQLDTMQAVFTREPAADFDLDVGLIYTHEDDLMPRLLSSLRASTDDLRVRLILVDNSLNGSGKPWQNIIRNTTLVRNGERLQYSSNLNRILNASTARYTLLLNTDMFFDPRQHCLRRMVQFMDAHPRCGISGCRLYHADGQDARAARRFQTLSVILARRCGLGRVLRHTLDRYLYRDREPQETFACDWLSGCFLMVRRQAFNQVGFFDEQFGKYFEDVDICLRMARSGWQVLYHGGTCCYHLERRASKRLLSADAWRHLCSYFYWLSKWGYSTRRFLAPAPQ
ncbi:MAG: glycosyltransferase [Thermoguttaceae bacterium]|jgi:GT2 family glycosyltransferase